MVTAVPRMDLGTGVSPVISNGMCIGCGACAALEGTSHRMALTPHGLIEATAQVPPDQLADQRAGTVCPFADAVPNESHLAKTQFPELRAHEMLGPVLASYAGYAAEGDFRDRGGSGGIGTWLLEQLLASGAVDAVVHVGSPDVSEVEADGPALFAYRISRDVHSLRAGAKSKYYPVTLAEVIPEVRRQPGRYAFVGVPCFVKAVRLMARQDPMFGQSVAICVGLVCGHLKSRGFAEFLAWQMGIAPDRLGSFDFRQKLPDRAANRYGARATTKACAKPAIDAVAPMQDLYGHDWGMGLFKPRACDYCDDVVAETADVTIGDAWLPRFVKDDGGTNVIIVRNAVVDRLFQEGVQAGRIHLEPLSAEDVVQSQASGFAHRRDGLAYRLWLADSQSQWRPIKRVQPRPPQGDTAFERRHRLRMALAERSHVAFLVAKQAGRLDLFFRAIVPLAERYRDQSRPWGRRLVARLRLWFIGDRQAKRAILASKQNR